MCFRQELLIFGSANAGTPLMQANQAIGIDLPLKALVHEMQPARYGSPAMIRTGSQKRHGLGAAVAQTVDAMATALNAVATKATKSP